MSGRDGPLRRGEAKWARATLIERDGPFCCICGGGLDLTIPARLEDGRRNNHPGKPTFEHRRRQADGGGHEIENLGLAHLRCNLLLGLHDGCVAYWTDNPGGRIGRRRRIKLILLAWPALTEKDLDAQCPGDRPR